MIKEYVEELLLQNNEELEKLEKQMKDLLSELDAAKEWMETLQAEENVDKNIFSPRSVNNDLKNKIESAQNSINRIKQDIEYVRSFIETHLKKKQEYEKMINELENFNNSNSDHIHPTQITDESALDKEVSANLSQSENKDSVQVNKTVLFDLCKKVDICLAFLNSNKNSCRSELKEIKNMIKNIMEEN